MPKLSVTIITRNEAAHVADAIDSVAWADEIIVVDSESTDDTIAIAARHHAPRDRARLARLRGTEELRRVDGDPRLDSVA